MRHSSSRSGNSGTTAQPTTGTTHPPGAPQSMRWIADGWLERRSTLLTTSEADYINYFLNQSGPTGGPDLRNRYLHGSQADGDDKAVHLHTYLIALRLLIALVIKLNDDLSPSTQTQNP